MMTRHVMRVGAFCAALCFYSFHSQAQLLVDPNVAPVDLAQLLVGTGVQISNVSVNAADSSYGYYSSAGTEIGTSEGLLLTTGNVINAYGPNNSSGLPQLQGGNCLNCDFFDNDWPGSDLLDNAQDRDTYDATLFEFDVIPQGDSLKFSFTFASEEYLEWVGSPFNDVFGFFITGPNIGVDVNIAVLPGTSEAVAINNVNPGNNPQYFYNNINPQGQNIQYDGFTVGLQAIVGDLIPCETYHLKLIIADGSDRLYDSAVFVEKIESNPVTVLTATSGGLNYMIEGCNDGTITFQRPNITDQEQVVTFWIGGTATDGVDFTPQIGTGTPGDPLVVVIPANESSVTIDLEAIADGLDEGSEYITIYLANPLCDGGIQDSVNFYIEDFLEVNVSPIDPTICFGQCVQLTSDAETELPATFFWDPTDGLSNPNITNPEACPAVTTTYTITSQISDCIATASTTITVTNIEAILTPENTTCGTSGQGSVTLTVVDATEPLTIEWTGPDGFTSTEQNIDNLEPGQYCVTVTDANGCVDSECVTIVEEDILTISDEIFSDFICFPISCFGACDGSISVVVEGGLEPYTIVWDDPALQTGPTASNLCAGTYNVTITDAQGCEISASYTLEQPDQVEIELVGTIDVLCNGDQTGVATVTSTGGCTPYFYSWSHDPILNTPVATNLPSGTFTVFVTDVNGCASSDAVTIEIGEPGEPISATFDVSLYPNGFNVSCFDANDGSIDMTVSGGTPAYSILWFQNGFFFSATEDVNNLSCGNYTVEITDVNGCEFTQDVEITCPPAITIQSSSTPNPCLSPDAGLGTIDVTVGGGNPGYDYDWSGPDGYTSTDEDLTGLNSGTYTLTVTDSDGCSQTINVIVATSLEIIIDGIVTDASCFGACDGMIDITANGGGGGFTFEWTQNGNFISNAEDLTGLCAGTYQVLVTDLGGCTQVAQFTVGQPAEIEITIDNIVYPSCFGLNDGSIEISVSGGTGVLTVEWLPYDAPILPDFPGSLNEDIFNLFDGIYTVVVTDETGCSNTLIVPLNAPQIMDIFVEVTQFGDQFNISCAGAGDGQISVSVSGGTPDCVLFDPYCYSYDWGASPIGANDPASPILTDLNGGTYLVIVTDANGCVATTEIPMIEPEPIAIGAILSDYNGFNISCYNGDNGTITPIITGGTGIYENFDWSGGDPIGANAPDAATLVDLPAGTYVLEVTDSNDCVFTGTFELTEPDPITVNVDAAVIPSCYEYSDGALSVTASGGVADYDYVWTGPSCPCTGNVIANIEAGEYVLTVIDNNGCSIDTLITLDEAPLFDVSLNALFPNDSAQFNIACNGELTGEIITIIEGGEFPFDIVWTLDGNFFSTEQNLSDLGPGEYCITVTDFGGCITTDCVTITEPQNPLVVQADVLVYGNGFNISCFNACDGSIDLTVSGGVAPYYFIWRDEFDNEIAFTEDLSGLCAGAYEVLIIDSNGCEETLNFDLTEPAELFLTASSSLYNDGFNISCAGAADGSISAEASGGVADYDYQWSGSSNANTADISGLSGGTYTLTVTDAAGCTIDTTIILIEPLPISFNPDITGSGCPGETNGSIDANISGGSGDYVSIDWTNAPDGNELITDLGPGDYTLVVTDSNGCTETEIFTIDEPVAITVVTSTVDASCGQANGSISLDIEGGLLPLDIVWDGPTNVVDGTTNANNLLEGSYTILITDANNCSVEVDVELNGTPAISGNGQAVNVSCFGEADGSIGLVLSNGVEPYEITWFDSEGTEIGSGNSLEGLSGGSYSVEVVDANGCTYSSTWQIAEPSAILINAEAFEFPNGFNISTSGGEDGSIAVEVGGGNPAYTYDWEGPGNYSSSDEDINGLSAGEYTLIVTDESGCSSDTTIILTQPSDLLLPTGLSPNGDGLNDGYVILGLEGYEKNTFKVFNRWGNLVYEKTNYANEWKGTNQDNEDLPDGTYYVIFEASGRSFNTYVDLRR
jgi:gliding motility-associated-like protein